MGSRYGGMKQIDPVGPSGQVIIDYSLYDARRAGFETVIFVIKHDETVSDELLGVYSKAEDTALSAAFRGQKKKRLNRVFDAVGFVYPDYRYPVQGQKRKGTTSTKETAAAAPSEPAPKRKRVKGIHLPPSPLPTALS